MQIDGLRSRHIRRNLYILLAAGVGIALAIFAEIGQSTMAQSVPTDPNGFTAYMAEQFRHEVPDAEIQIVGTLHLLITAPSGQTDLYLDTVYSACQRGVPCPMQIETYVSQMVAVSRDTKSTVGRESLRVLVRPAVYAAQLRQNAVAQGGAVMEPLQGDLLLVAASDEPTAIQMVTMRDLSKLGLSVDAGIALA